LAVELRGYDRRHNTVVTSFGGSPHKRCDVGSYPNEERRPFAWSQHSTGLGYGVRPAGLKNTSEDHALTQIFIAPPAPD
jgi:hypothetical protein